MKKDKKIFNSRTMPYFMMFLLLGTVMGTTMVTSYVMSSDNVWLDRGDGTVVLLNTSNNVLIGENRTTSYRLEVNGTALINDTLYLTYNRLVNANLSEYAGDNLFWDWNTFTLNTTWFNPFNQSLNTTDNVEFVDIYATGNIETDGYVSSDSYVEIGQGLYHKDDANTNILFTPDRMRFYIGGLNFLDMEESTADSFIVNPDRYDVDFVVNGDNEYDVLKVDAKKDTTHMGHGIQRGYVTTSNDYTVTSADNFIYVETSGGNVDIDLPNTEVNSGMTLTIFHLGGGGNRVDINGYSTQNINGAGTQSLEVQYDSITIHANNKEAEWFIISDTR